MIVLCIAVARRVSDRRFPRMRRRCHDRTGYLFPLLAVRATGIYESPLLAGRKLSTRKGSSLSRFKSTSAM